MIKTSTEPIRVGAKSHPGKVREENQDRMGRFHTPFGDLVLVVDGMGGHKGGATAAEMVVAGVSARLQQAAPGMNLADAIKAAVTACNDEIMQASAAGGPELHKMGATAVIAILNDGIARIAHVGDSRAYLLRGGKLQRLTRDHSVVQRMVDQGMLSEEEARNHPDASVISRAFGQKPGLEPEIAEPLTLQSGDGLLLCSDGLCGYVNDAQIEAAANLPGDVQAVTDRMIEMALVAGGEDNVTVQFVQYGPRPAITPPPLPVGIATRPLLQAKLNFLQVGLMLLMALVIGFIIGQLWSSKSVPVEPMKSVAEEKSGAAKHSNPKSSGAESSVTSTPTPPPLSTGAPIASPPASTPAGATAQVTAGSEPTSAKSPSLKTQSHSAPRRH